MNSATTKLRTKVGLGLAALTLAVAGVATTAVEGGGSHTKPAVETGTPQDRHATKAANSPALQPNPQGPLPMNERAQARSDGGREARVPEHARGHEEEVETGEASNGYSGAQLQYKVGPVQTSPRIYLVLWGSNWFTNGDPNGVSARLHYFFQGVGGSNWANVLKQFSGSTGAFTNPTGQYKGWIQDTSAVPAQPTKAQILAAGVRAAQRLNDYGYNAQYVVATPYGVVDQFSTANRFCGWHDWTYAGGGSNWVTVTSLPYAPYLDALGRGCGGGKVNGTNGKLDGVTILASHEYAESVNDPGLNAWADSGGSENADKCSWVNLANYRLTNGYTLPVQPYWSNLWKSQYGYGCYYS